MWLRVYEKPSTGYVVTVHRNHPAAKVQIQFRRVPWLGEGALGACSSEVHRGGEHTATDYLADTDPLERPSSSYPLDCSCFPDSIADAMDRTRAVLGAAVADMAGIAPAAEDPVDIAPDIDLD